MRIAVIYHRDERGNGYGMYISELLSDYAEWLGYKIFSLYEFTANTKKDLPENAVISIPVNLTSSAGLYWFYSLQLPSTLKKINADIMVCINGTCSISVRIPQLLIIPGSGYFENKKAKKYPWQKLSLKFFAKSMNKCAATITYSRHIINSTEKFTGKKIESPVIPFTSPPGFHQLEWGDKVLVKAQFTGNKEFFLCVINNNSEEDYVQTLKAFSKFKKWQQSSMQLLFIEENDFMAESLKEKLTTYKYRDDVQVLQNITSKQTADLTAAAYALLYIQKADGGLLPVLQSLQSTVPVIAYENKNIREYCGDAALYAKEESYESFGEQMIYLYKNETRRGEMIECCRRQAGLFNREKASVSLWSLLEEIMKLRQ